MFDHFAQRLANHFMSTPTIDKMFDFERLKVLGAANFEGTTNSADVEKWLCLIGKCFREMECPKERKVKLVTFLL